MKKYVFMIIALFTGLAGYAQNDVMFWEPVAIVQGGTVDIYYNTINGALPDDPAQVLIHLGYNGWTNVDDLPMTAQSEGWWMYHYAIPEDADILDFVFQDGEGNWDNNGGEGIDFHISVNVPGIWEPMFPGPNDTIRISKQHDGSGNLWWGVNSWIAPLPAYQPENTVDGDPGLSVESTLLGPDSNDVYWVDIGPFNDPHQAVAMVDFVFHWDDGSWEGTGSGDYHFPISYEPGVNDPLINMTNIENDHVLDDEQLIQIETQDANYVEVLLDGNTRYISGGGDFEFTTNTGLLSYGRHELVAYARRDNGRVMMDIKTVWKIPEVVEDAFPPFDFLGVHDRLDGTITFALLAPGKMFVSLIGDFNDWDADSGLMKYDPAQEIYWLNLPLEAGSYEYMYVLNGEKTVGDPMATDVNWTDLFGNEHWASENQKSVINIGAEAFPWTDDSYQRPAMKDLIIYETLIRDFTESGDIEGMTAKLDYLADLGINAIELLPPTEFSGDNSWGYNPAFFMALESSYGTPEQMKIFVNEAHARGISVLVDLVFNHADGTSPYEQMYGNDYEHSPYMHAEGNAWGFPDFDHGRTGTRVLTARTVRHWISEYHVDGYRYDHTPGIGWSGASDFGVSYFSNQAYLEDNEVVQIAEHFDSDIGSLIFTTHIRSHWHDAFHDQMKANLRQGDFEGSHWWDMDKTERGIDYSADGFQDGEACVNYVESHDEQRIIFEVQTNGLSYEQALNKAELAAQVLFTSTGIPMFYMGAELGMDTERTLSHNPVRWHYLEDPVLETLWFKYQEMIWLRQNYAALRSNNIDVVFKSNAQKVIVHHRTLDGAPGVVVAINFNSSDQVLDLEFPWAGTWYEYTQDDTLTIESNYYGSYTIPASSARIFTNERYWVGVDQAVNLPLEFALHAAFPNPFNPRTTLRFDLPEAALVGINIYDVRGREIWSTPESVTHYVAGSHEFSWNGVDQQGQSIAAGIYFIELRTPEFRQVQKVMLIK
ncbi:MAG: alpha-amylase family glycosyl hydrolase [Candidatus Marinimicrobia bacterium]|nr:alpha-amylase family glycosyl hydrolase [Candidatus Neomarinimicrobiota bacterium]